MYRILNKSKILCITLLTAAIFISFPDPASAVPIYRGTEGNFTINDEGFSKFKRLIRKDLYMSIQFDMVVEDLPNLIEPPGVSNINVPHFNDPKVKEIFKIMFHQQMYDRYIISYRKISKKMEDVNGEIEHIKTMSSKKLRTALTPEEKESEKERWRRIDELIREMNTFYNKELNNFTDDIFIMCSQFQETGVYRAAEQKNADIKVSIMKKKEIAMEFFSVAGSALRVAYGDLTSIVSLISNTVELLKTLKSDFSKNVDDFYDNYLELIEAMEMLERSSDASRITTNLARASKARDVYMASHKKMRNPEIFRVTLEQIVQNITNIKSSIDYIKNNTSISGPGNYERFIELQKQIMKLEEAKTEAGYNLAEVLKPFEEFKSLCAKADRLIMIKTTRLNAYKKSGSKGDFYSYYTTISGIVDNIYSTTNTILQFYK